jgi:hypothetical protein
MARIARRLRYGHPCEAGTYRQCKFAFLHRRLFVIRDSSFWQRIENETSVIPVLKQYASLYRFMERAGQ